MALAADTSAVPVPRLAALGPAPLVPVSAGRAVGCAPTRAPLDTAAPQAVRPALAAEVPRSHRPGASEREDRSPVWQRLPRWAMAGGALLLAGALLSGLARSLHPRQPGDPGIDWRAALDSLRQDASVPDASREEALLAEAPSAAGPQAPPEAAEPAPAPEAEAAPDPAELASAINAELQRADKAHLRVEVGPDYEAQVRGRAVDEAERQAVLQWLAGIDGLRGVRDGLRVQPHARPAEPLAPPAVAPPPVRPATAIAIAPPSPPALPANAAPSPPPPDPQALARTLRHELDRLGLADLQVQVDPASLQITLSGSVNDAARKGRAIAIARALNPGSRVRDLVFVIEE